MGSSAGNQRQRLAQQQIVDQRIGGQRQMMTVLLDGRRRQHQQRRFARQRVYLFPREISEVASRRESRSSLFTVCLRKLIILPGFSRPRGSYFCFACS